MPVGSASKSSGGRSHCCATFDAVIATDSIPAKGMVSGSNLVLCSLRFRTIGWPLWAELCQSLSLANPHRPTTRAFRIASAKDGKSQFQANVQGEWRHASVGSAEAWSRRRAGAKGWQPGTIRREAAVLRNQKIPLSARVQGDPAPRATGPRRIRESAPPAHDCDTARKVG